MLERAISKDGMSRCLSVTLVSLAQTVQDSEIIVKHAIKRCF